MSFPSSLKSTEKKKKDHHQLNPKKNEKEMELGEDVDMIIDHLKNPGEKKNQQNHKNKNNKNTNLSKNHDDDDDNENEVDFDYDSVDYHDTEMSPSTFPSSSSSPSSDNDNSNSNDPDTDSPPVDISASRDDLLFFVNGSLLPTPILSLSETVRNHLYDPTFYDKTQHSPMSLTSPSPPSASHRNIYFKMRKRCEVILIKRILKWLPLNNPNPNHSITMFPLQNPFFITFHALGSSISHLISFVSLSLPNHMEKISIAAKISKIYSQSVMVSDQYTPKIFQKEFPTVEVRRRVTQIDITVEFTSITMESKIAKSSSSINPNSTLTSPSPPHPSSSSSPSPSSSPISPLYQQTDGSQNHHNHQKPHKHTQQQKNKDKGKGRQKSNNNL